MKKVLDKALEIRIDGMIEDGKSGVDIVNLLKDIQDASGLKVCQNITAGDPAYKEV